MNNRNPTNTYLSALNDQQAEAVKHEGSPLLILAGAGSGKTRVITVKIAYLIRERDVAPHSILAVTFTNKAANEMRTRAGAIEASAADVFMRTFHSFGAWFLRRNCHVLDMPSGFSIYDDDDVISLLRGLYPDLERNQLASYARGISRAKDYLLGPDDDLSAITTDPDLPEVYRSYEGRLRKIGNVDFGDLIALPVRILRENPEIRERTRDRFRVIMVDEYQDSNMAQHQLLRELYRDRNGESSYLCVVGDDDQSIYRFRGAEVRNILTFGEDFPGTQIIRLEQNYRSTPSILSVASSVVEHNTGRLGKTLWTQRAAGAMPVLSYVENQDEEASYCAGLLSKENFGKTAILYRTNAQSRLFESLFLRMKIPYRIVGTVRFYEREEIKDTLAYLRVIANPRDEVSFRRIINKPARGIGNASVDRIMSRIGETGGDLLAAAGLSRDTLGKRQVKSISEFLDLLEDLTQSMASLKFSEFVKRVIEKSGLHYYHEHRDEVAGRQKLANLEELVNAATLYDNVRTSLQDFLESVELDTSREVEEEDDPNRVTLITMHNTKGLEFDRVIITGMEESTFPRGGNESIEDVEEERRLFYVAITRAKNELYFTSCHSRIVHGQHSELMPSRFLGEIPSDLVHVVGRRPYGGTNWYSNSNRRPMDDIDPDIWSGYGDDGVGLQPPVSTSGDYPVGTGVYHDRFGTGVVVDQQWAGSDEVVLVQFETGKTARFLPKYTPLERVSIDD